MPVTGPNSDLFNTGNFQSGGPRVLIVDEPHKADFNVFFVDYPHKEQNADALYDAKIVKYPERADMKLRLVDEPHLARIHITRENFPA